MRVDFDVAGPPALMVVTRSPIAWGRIRRAGSWLFVAAFLILLWLALRPHPDERLAEEHRAGQPMAPATPGIPAGAAERLAHSTRFRTVSFADSVGGDSTAFAGLHGHLQSSYPRVHASLRRETVGRHSLLYTWVGADTTLQPVLLAAHLDVVPVEPGTEAQWQEDPFGGQVADGYVWGRGAIDNKSAVLGTLEAIEMLLAEGFRPR
ncbi:MAG: M20/M25/M40 family metallo-hydrolase, partial [Gemmatimonadota bacterium]